MGAMNERLVVNGSCVTDCTCRYMTRIDEAPMRSAVYPSLMMRYMVQHDMVIQHKTARTNVNVLDVGCSNGAAARLYNAPFGSCPGRRPVDYIGVDVHFPSIENAVRNTPVLPSRLRTVQYFLADLSERWGFVMNDWADVIWYTEVIEHVPVDRALFTLEECYRVARRGCTMMVATPAPLNGERVWPDSHDHEFTREELRVMIEKSGWKITDVWGVGVNWTQARKRLTVEQREMYDTLRRRVSASFAKATMQALLPDVCDDLAWMCVKET